MPEGVSEAAYVPAKRAAELKQSRERGTVAVLAALRSQPLEMRHEVGHLVEAFDQRLSHPLEVGRHAG